jgi:hypothetical protein
LHSHKAFSFNSRLLFLRKIIKSKDAKGYMRMSNLHKRWISLVFLTIGISTFFIPSIQVKADYYLSDYGDLISVHMYVNSQKPGEAPEFWLEKKAMDIYMGEAPIPASINQTLAEHFSRRYDIVLETVVKPVRDELVGLRINRQKDFRIVAEKLGITNASDPLYETDLIYEATLLEIIIDVNIERYAELTLTHPLVLSTILGGIAVITVLFYYRVPQKIYNKVYYLQTSKCTECGKPATAICGNINCKSRICRSCFQDHKGCPICSGLTITSLKNV